MTPLVLQIAVPAPLYRLFDYLAPPALTVAFAAGSKTLAPGVRVKIPWGASKEITGVLIAHSHHSDWPLDKLKYISEILDETPLFSPELFKLICFAADYYHYPLGEVFAAAMPAKLRQGHSSADYRAHYSPFEAPLEVMPLLALNHWQQLAVHQVCAKLGEFQAFLLFGITGSGKTEVYLQAIAEVLARGRQALVLVPEIGLTPQTVMRFQQRFRVTIAVLHSGLGDRERHDAWLQAARGDAPIVIGTRSAIFTPLARPGIIIIDEEHDLSFKQQDGFRYSARDLAVMRAQYEHMPVILGSATPSLESLYNAKIKRYILLSLPERAGSAVHPTFQLIDLRKFHADRAHGLSEILLDKMREHLANHGQILLFINRRGYAPTLMCHDCGWVASCPHCDARLTVHQKLARLACHYCGNTKSLPEHCPDCEASRERLLPMGTGTEKIEEALQKLFPKTPILRIDSDSTRQKGALQKKLDEVQAGAPCILVGTQMLAKGHHFANVTLAVVLNIDSGLLGVDFRGPERTAQLIMQVAGRAGRVERPGEVALQTYHADHQLLRVLLGEGYEAFADGALSERKTAGFPPYQAMALVRAEAMQTEPALHFLRELKRAMQAAAQGHGVMLLGPVMAQMPRRAGRHRAQLLLKCADRKALRLFLTVLMAHLGGQKARQRVRWALDVDPQETL